MNAVLAAGLEGVLGDAHADFAVCAPTDQAFVHLARDLGLVGGGEAEAFDTIVAALTALGDGDPIPLLTAILTYHVVPGALQVKDVVLSEQLDTLLTGASIHPDAHTRRLVDNEPDFTDPRFMVSIKRSAEVLF